MSSLQDMKLIIPCRGRISLRGQGDPFSHSYIINRCVPDGDKAENAAHR
jgi:hypothetical protein